MRFRLSSIAAVGALAGVASAQAIMYAQYWDGSRYVKLPTWYGDGDLYVGSEVPANVATALNFTVPNDRADLLYITGPGLPDPTFAVVDDSAGAAGPVFFRHSAAGLADGALMYWTRYGQLLLPLGPGGSLHVKFVLDGTGTPGTYAVKWKAGELSASSSAATAALSGRGRGKRRGRGTRGGKRDEVDLAGTAVTLLAAP